MKSSEQPDTERPLTIGALAGRFGLATHVLRHWESVGLLNPARDAAGRRVYGAADAVRTAMILRAKEAGLSLEAIRTVLTPPAEAGEPAQPAQAADAANAGAPSEPGASGDPAELAGPSRSGDPGAPAGSSRRREVLLRRAVVLRGDIARARAQLELVECALECPYTDPADCPHFRRAVAGALARPGGRCHHADGGMRDGAVGPGERTSAGRDGDTGGAGGRTRGLSAGVPRPARG